MDVFSKAKRSEIMSRVKGTGNAATEGKLVKLLREAKISGWRRNYKLDGKPDLVFYLEGVAVFVDGCFWHGCPTHGERPATNREFWRKKIERNIRRDRKVNRLLKSKGWVVLRVWQHQLRHEDALKRRFLRVLGRTG